MWVWVHDSRNVSSSRVLVGESVEGCNTTDLVMGNLDVEQGGIVIFSGQKSPLVVEGLVRVDSGSVFGSIGGYSSGVSTCPAGVLHLAPYGVYDLPTSSFTAAVRKFLSTRVQHGFQEVLPVIVARLEVRKCPYIFWLYDLIFFPTLSC